MTTTTTTRTDIINLLNDATIANDDEMARLCRAALKASTTRGAAWRACAEVIEEARANADDIDA